MEHKQCIMRVLDEDEYVKPVVAIAKIVRLIAIEFSVVLFAMLFLIISLFGKIRH